MYVHIYIYIYTYVYIYYMFSLQGSWFRKVSTLNPCSGRDWEPGQGPRQADCITSVAGLCSFVACFVVGLSHVVCFDTYCACFCVFLALFAGLCSPHARRSTRSQIRSPSFRDAATITDK